MKSILPNNQPRTTWVSKFCSRTPAEFLFLPGMLLLITWTVFAGSLSYEMYLNMDDGFYVIFNRQLDFSPLNIYHWFTNSVLGLYTPLPMLSFMVDHALWSDNVIGYHLQNMLWHSLTVLVVYRLFRALNLSVPVAFFVTMLFAIHPQRVESVVWISERKDVMSGFFYFSSLLLWYKSDRRGKAFSPTSCLMMVAGCLSKPMAVTIPAVIGCFLWRKHKKIIAKTYVTSLAPYLTIALSYILVKYTYLDHIANDLLMPEKNWTRTLFKVASNYQSYLCKTFFPYGLTPLYPHYELTMFSVLTVLTFTVVFLFLLYRFYARYKAEIVYDIVPVLLGFVITLTPVVGLFDFSNTDFADRYSYIPSVFLLYGAARIVILISNALPKLKAFLVPMGIVYSTLIASTTIFYMRCWTDNHTLVQAMSESGNPNFRGLAIRAKWELDQGNLDEALAYASMITPPRQPTAIQIKACMLFRDYIGGLVCHKRGQYDKAWEYFSRIIASSEIVVLKSMAYESCREIIIACGDISLRRHKPEQAAEFYLFMPIIYPENLIDAYFFQGLACYLKGEFGKAYDLFMIAHRHSPRDFRVLYNLKATEKQLQCKLEKGIERKAETAPKCQNR